MNRERLEKLIEILRNPDQMIGVGVFDMNYFCSIRLPGDIIQYDKQNIINNHCNTAACALGVAALHPWFIKKGLKIVCDITRHNTYNKEPCWVEYNGECGILAARDFFEICDDIATYLFNPWEYETHKAITPIMIADRIQSLLDDNKGV